MLGPKGQELPDSVLFACNMNAVRSPMAAAIMRHLYGKWVYVESIGVRTGQLDGFANEVMQEIGIDITQHAPRSFDELHDTSFDLIISLTPQAHHKAIDLTRTISAEVEYWPTFDPTVTQGQRDQILEGYRNLRDQLIGKIKERFGNPTTPNEPNP